MVGYKRTSSKKELVEILELQRRNLPEALTEDERRTDGFVTVRHSLELLWEMHEACPHIIAEDMGRVVGYALCMAPEFSRSIPVLEPMFLEIDTLFEQGLSYLVMGQICVERAYRGQGLFRNMYRLMKASLPKAYDCIVTEVDSTNLRSLRAHYGIGFEHLKTYASSGQEWQLLIWK